jgi:hypothetical protein
MKHSFSVVQYAPGLEDGYISTSSMSKSNFYRAAIVPFIYDQDGNKQRIFDGDYIIITNNNKTLKPKEALKYSKYI